MEQKRQSFSQGNRLSLWIWKSALREDNGVSQLRVVLSAEVPDPLSLAQTCC